MHYINRTSFNKLGSHKKQLFSNPQPLCFDTLHQPMHSMTNNNPCTCPVTYTTHNLGLRIVHFLLYRSPPQSKFIYNQIKKTKFVCYTISQMIWAFYRNNIDCDGEQQHLVVQNTKSSIVNR